MQEHEAIKQMMRVMDGICNKLESGQQVPVEHLEQILEFLRVFVDSCHHGKEQDVLFPAMVEAGFPGEGGPIGVMLAEHDIGRGFIKGLAEAIGQYKENAGASTAEIVRNAREYTSLLVDHIEKENGILYPMADAQLSEERQQEMLVEFDRVESEKIGQGKHEEFHRLLDHLAETYL